MKNLTIGQIADQFKEKFSLDDIYDDIELQFIWQRISEKISIYDINWHYKPQGEMLRLLKSHLPSLFPNLSEDHDPMKLSPNRPPAPPEYSK